MGNRFQAFKVVYNSVVRDIRTFTFVSEAFEPKRLKTPPKSIKYEAIWDTGAQKTIISSQVVADLGLKSISLSYLAGVHTRELANVYLVNLILPNRVRIIGLDVLEVKAVLGADVLIGMDIMSLGDVVITNKSRTEFAFSFPSSGNLDFLKLEPSETISPATQALTKEKVGRNDPCPCGSGKKYKYCHGR